MTVTITATNGAGVSHPISVLSPYNTARAARNVVHDLLGGGVAVSLVAPNLRSGYVDLLFSDEAEAWSCLDLHSQVTTFTLDDSTRPPVSMTYVVTSEASIALDEATQEQWLVTVSYQEVTGAGVL